MHKVNDAYRDETPFSATSDGNTGPASLLFCRPNPVLRGGIARGIASDSECAPE